MTNDSAMHDEVKGLRDYLLILQRRKAYLIVPALLLLVVSVVTAFVLPATYRSTATILIEQQEVPKELVRASVTSYADQRIQVISQRVMTSKNLGAIVDKYDLYTDERRNEPLEETLKRLREAISLEMVSADVVDPRSGRPTEATIAFTLSYKSRSPQLAQKVTNELVSLYLNENIESRTQLAADTTTFLGTEADRLDNEVAMLEQQLAEFKQKNVGNLPELVNVNLELMDRTERQLLEVDREIRSLRERQVFLEAELGRLDPYSDLYSESGERILSPADRLKAVKSQYVTSGSRLSPDHPDIKRMRREIEALEAELKGEGDTTTLERELAGTRVLLAEAKERYSDDHPDVKRLQRTVATLQVRLKHAAAAKQSPLPTSKPDNPAYVQIQAQLDANRTDVRSLEQTKQELKEKLAQYEERLIQTPQAEREYRALNRRYENALAKYNETKAKLMEAQLSESLEKERKGERFTLIEPPLLPEKPFSPNRPAILFLGMVFSVAGGIGTTALKESLDQTVRDARDLMRLTGAYPMSVIAAIETREEVSRRSRIRIAAILAAVAVIGGMAAAVHFLFMPLDVLAFALMRKLGIPY